MMDLEIGFELSDLSNSTFLVARVPAKHYTNQRE